MKKLISLFVLLSSIFVIFTACTENSRAKNYGGTATIDLPKGQKLITVTWKENDLWYLTKPMSATDVPETYSFKQESDFGIISGTVIINESK